MSDKLTTWNNKLFSYNGKYIRTTVTDAPTIYSDNFETRSNGALAGQGLWVQEKNTITVFTSTNQRVRPGTAGGEIAVFYNVAVDGDQWSQMTYLGGISGYAIGPAVRCQGGTGYYYGWYSSATASYIFRNEGDDWYEIGDGDNRGTAWTSGDVVKLSISGFTLSCYRNGVLDTTVGSTGQVEDIDFTRLSGGYVGITGYSDSTSVYGDTWSGGSL